MIRIGFLVCIGCFSSAVAQEPGPRLDSQTAAPLVLPRCLITVLEQVEVPAREAGVLDFLEAKEGMLVSKGQVLGRLDSRRTVLEKKAAEVELKTAEIQGDNDVNVRFAKASRDVAQAELTRALDANAITKGTITDAELDERRLTLNKADLQIEQSMLEQQIARASIEGKRALLELAEENIQRRQVVAPLSGVVVERHRTVGEWLHPGDPVLRILRLDRLRVEGFIDAQQANAELLNRPVVVEVLLSGGRQVSLKGKVGFVSPEIEPVTGRVRIWAEVENEGLLLRPGLKASVTIPPSGDGER